MGSLTSRPKVLPVQQPEIITLAQPVTTPVVAPATTTASSSGANSSSSDDSTIPSPATARSANLLERSRGILSTVLTGFNGILTQTTAPQRKSLLGE